MPVCDRTVTQLPLKVAVAHPFVIINQAAKIEQVHHTLNTEEGLLSQLVCRWQLPGSGQQLGILPSLCPGNLLLPHLTKSSAATLHPSLSMASA